MKSKEELNKLKEEVEALDEKLQELTPEGIEKVSGGLVSGGAERLGHVGMRVIGFGTTVDVK